MDPLIRNIYILHKLGYIDKLMWEQTKISFMIINDLFMNVKQEQKITKEYT